MKKTIVLSTHTAGGTHAARLIAIGQTLALLGTVATVLLALAGTVVFLLLNRVHVARAAALFGLSVFGAYAAVLLTLSLTSHTTTLPPGQLKFFCEIDCHVAFDVISQPVRIGDTLQLTLRERFRRETSRTVAATHRSRRAHELLPSLTSGANSSRRWRVHQLDSAPLFAPMRPGEAHRAELRFFVPSDQKFRACW
jgi:hypothetical protein